MSELISRQAAVDALKSQLSDWNDDYNIPVRKSIENIERLPSAQPEIVRCKDCKHQEIHEYNYGGRTYHSYGCELSERYSHVCLDDDFCSRAERREE